MLVCGCQRLKWGKEKFEKNGFGAGQSKFASKAKKLCSRCPIWIKKIQHELEFSALSNELWQKAEFEKERKNAGFYMECKSERFPAKRRAESLGFLKFLGPGMAFAGFLFLAQNQQIWSKYQRKLPKKFQGDPFLPAR